MNVNYNIDTNNVLHLGYSKDEINGRSNKKGQTTIKIWPNPNFKDSTFIHFKITNTDKTIYRVTRSALKNAFRSDLFYYTDLSKEKELKEKIISMIEELKISHPKDAINKLGIREILKRELEQPRPIPPISEDQLLDFFSQTADRIKDEKCYEAIKNQILNNLDTLLPKEMCENLNDYDLSVNIYVQRFLAKYPQLNTAQFLPSLKFAALCVTLKYLIQTDISNELFAEYRLVNLPTIHQLEKIFMKGLDYNLFLSQEEITSEKVLQKLSKGINLEEGELTDWANAIKNSDLIHQTGFDTQMNQADDLLKHIDLTDRPLTEET